MGSKKRKREKFLSCVFLHDVLCLFRKREDSGVMEKCFACSHYKRFMLEAEEDDIRVMEEIDREREELEREMKGDTVGF